MFTIIGADGREYGPVSADQVKAWVAAGRANGQTKAKLEGLADWKTLADHPEFAGLFGVQPPPTVSPPDFSPPVVPPSAAGAPTAGPVDPAAYAADLIARAPKLEIGAALSRAWAFYTANFWGLVGATLIVLIVQVVSGLIPFLNLLLAGVFLGGLYCYYLRRFRGMAAEVSDVFAGFSLAFVPLMLGGLVSTLLGCLGLLFLILPGIYLMVAWCFTAPLIIDKQLDFWPAMEVSRRVVTAQWWQVFGLLLVAGFLAALGILGCGVGIFLTFPFAFCARVVAYETLCNPPPKAG